MSYTLTFTVGQTYTVGGFDTEQEAQAFLDKYRNNEDRLERDFEDLPNPASRQHTCFQNYNAVIEGK